jgi:transposase
LNLTVKKTLHPTEKESERVQQQRFEFWQLVQGILAKDLIFINESGINLALTRSFARSAKGKRPRGKRPQTRGKNVSLIDAIGHKGLITQVSLLGSTDGLTFETFVAQCLVPKLWSGACVLMDNCSIHKGAAIEALITQAGAKLIYLPPYSPDFLPIENCWRTADRRLNAYCVQSRPETILIWPKRLKKPLNMSLLRTSKTGSLTAVTVPQ